jgi:V8-like Glu-specific endopeptidase
MSNSEAGHGATSRGSTAVGIVLPGDNRVRVADSTTMPARWVGQIETTWPSGLVTYGTATLIGERSVLTCAHNFYDRRAGRYCRSVRFTPGRNRSGTGGPRSRSVTMTWTGGRFLRSTGCPAARHRRSVAYRSVT